MFLLTFKILQQMLIRTDAKGTNYMKLKERQISLIYVNT